MAEHNGNQGGIQNINDINITINGVGGNGGGNDNDEQKEIEERIAKFNKALAQMKEHLNRILGKLILNDDKDLDVIDAIKGLESELKDLENEARGLISEIDEFAKKYQNANFSIDYKQIMKELNELKLKLKKIKQTQVNQYNARVDLTNNSINELLASDELSEDVKNQLRGMLLEKCPEVIRDWRYINYLKSIDYNRLVEVNKFVKEVRNNLKLGGKADEKEYDTEYYETMMMLEEEMYSIETSIANLKSMDNFDDIASRVNDFRVLLENNKDKISEEDYNNFLGRVIDAQSNLYDFTKEPPIFIDTNKTEFDELMKKLQLLEREVIGFSFSVDAFYGNLKESAVNTAVEILETYAKRLDELVNEIEKAKADNKLDENQYNGLMKKVNEIRERLTKTMEKAKETGMVFEVNAFNYLNKKIDGVEAELADLDSYIETLDKPIKDKNIRKYIDDKIVKITHEIEFIERDLEKYKDSEPEKYQTSKERLEESKKKLEEVSKKYRSKCPLAIKAVKSANNFFKKHPKTKLIIAGLAAVALVHATVGPILIPAIMHGNIMIGYTTPALRGFVKFVNNILGGLIGATKTTDGFWFLANGIRINPSVASTSLLKGLAISGLGTTALLTPIIASLVVAIKKIMEKMNLAELKKKLEVGKVVEKFNSKNNENNNKKQTNKADRMSIDNLAKLLKEYRKSGVSLDEFCLQNELTDEEKTVLQYLEVQSRENVDGLNSSNGRGRK